MSRRIYLDTSVISALFDERTPERQEMTLRAWDLIKECDVYISDVVAEELQMATSALLARFNEVTAGFNVIDTTDEARELADAYVKQGIFPDKYYDDALHVAIASVNGIGLLLSWNFKHLVKLKTRRLVSVVNTLKDYIPVEIIAPPEL